MLTKNTQGDQGGLEQNFSEEDSSQTQLTATSSAALGLDGTAAETSALL